MYKERLAGGIKPGEMVGITAPTLKNKSKMGFSETVSLELDCTFEEVQGFRKEDLNKFFRERARRKIENQTPIKLYLGGDYVGPIVNLEFLDDKVVIEVVSVATDVRGLVSDKLPVKIDFNDLKFTTTSNIVSISSVSIRFAVTNSLDIEDIQDESSWNKQLRSIEFSKYGGMISVTGDEGVDRIEYGLIPISLLTDEITDKHNGLTNYYWVKVSNYEVGREIPNETVMLYLDRVISFLIYNGRGDFKSCEDKGQLGLDRTFVIGFQKL